MKDNASNESLYDMIYEIADTVIEIKEIDAIDLYKKEVFDLAMKNVEAFFKEVNKKIDQCKDDEEKIFVKEATFNFLLIAIKKHIVDFDVSNENIDMIASHLNKLILNLKKE